MHPVQWTVVSIAMGGGDGGSQGDSLGEIG